MKRKRTHYDDAWDALMDQGAKLSELQSSMDTLEPYVGRGTLAGARRWTKALWDDNKTALESLEQQRKVAA